MNFLIDMAIFSKNLQEAFRTYQSIIDVIVLVQSSDEKLTIYCGYTIYNVLHSTTTSIKDKANFILDENRENYEYGFTAKQNLINDVDEFFE